MKTGQGTWKAIVFDFDGTLAKLNIDFSAMRAAIMDLLSDYHIPEKEINHLHILEMVDAAGNILAERSQESSTEFLHLAYELITRMEVEAAQKGGLFDNTIPLLTGLQRRFIRIGVVTRNCRAAVLQVFPDIDLYCKTVLTRNDPCRVKPHPDHLITAFRLLNVTPCEAAMVGDHPMDILLGRRAGTFTIGVLTGNSDREAFLRAKADLIIPNAAHLLDMISP